MLTKVAVVEELVGSSPFLYPQIGNRAFELSDTAAFVPEPATLMLFAVGLVGAAAKRGRRRSN